MGQRLAAFIYGKQSNTNKGEEDPNDAYRDPAGKELFAKDVTSAV